MTMVIVPAMCSGGTRLMTCSERALEPGVNPAGARTLARIALGLAHPPPQRLGSLVFRRASLAGAVLQIEDGFHEDGMGECRASAKAERDHRS